jgi:hypothetical protein
MKTPGDENFCETVPLNISTVWLYISISRSREISIKIQFLLSVKTSFEKNVEDLNILCPPDMLYDYK